MTNKRRSRLQRTGLISVPDTPLVDIRNVTCECQSHFENSARNTTFKLFGLETILRNIPIPYLTNILMLKIMTSNIIIHLLGNIMLSGLHAYAKKLWRF